MRFFAVIIAVLCAAQLAFAQDGSDILYAAPAEIDAAYVGRFVHFDFGRNSFRPAFANGERPLDKVEIEVDGRKVAFTEHRVDDGFNNWFGRQYLEAVAPYKGKILRIRHFELLGVKEKEFAAKAFFVFVDQTGSELSAGAFTRNLTFAKAGVVAVLVRSKD